MPRGGTVNNPFTQTFSVASATVIKVKQLVKRGDGNKLEPCGAGEQAVAVAEMASAAGESTENFAANILSERSRLVGIAGADIALTAGTASPLKSDANGELIDQGGTGVIVGYALESASDGDWIEFQPVGE